MRVVLCFEQRRKEMILAVEFCVLAEVLQTQVQLSMQWAIFPPHKTIGSCLWIYPLMATQNAANTFEAVASLVMKQVINCLLASERSISLSMLAWWQLLLLSLDIAAALAVNFELPLFWKRSGDPHRLESDDGKAFISLRLTAIPLRYKEIAQNWVNGVFMVQYREAINSKWGRAFPTFTKNHCCLSMCQAVGRFKKSKFNRWLVLPCLTGANGSSGYRVPTDQSQ